MKDIDSEISTNTTAVYLRELATDIRKGRLGVPPFQRGFVWKRQQIIDLFDSIWKRYPIGSFLLWTRDSEWKGTKDILSGKGDANATPVWYILDGCQRLASFYGCTLNDDSKNADFKLHFDLETQSFGYFNRKSNNIVPVASIYDTFELLNVLERLRAAYPTDVANKYIANAKELNARLQEYTVSRIIMDQCSLDQATTVFTRLNSKGTDISKPEMLQAMAYKSFDNKSLLNVLSEIRASLEPYGFDGLSNEDILNCFFKFYNKDFFDISFKEMERLQPLQYEEDVKATVALTAKFLNHACKVESSSLLPYRNQFQSLVWWFRKHPDTTRVQEIELRKWFYYTTINFTFQNGSIGYLRKLFDRFDKYVNGLCDSPIDYCITFQADSLNLDFKVKHNSSRTKLMMIALIDHYRNNHDEEEDSLSYYRYIYKGKHNVPASYFPILSDNDTATLKRIFQGSGVSQQDNLEKFALTIDMVNAFRADDEGEFIRLRSARILEIERSFLLQQLYGK